MQDCDIIKLYFDRDESAISETAAKYGEYLTTIAKNILYDVFDAEECVNDTYMRTWESVPPTYPTRFSAFLAKITRNISLDRYKSKHAEKRGGRVAASLEELSECVGEGDVEAELDYRELGEAISRFLRNRRELARRVFICRYFYQKSVSEISVLHRISEASVKTLLHRERIALREFLLKEGMLV